MGAYGSENANCEVSVFNEVAAGWLAAHAVGAVEAARRKCDSDVVKQKERDELVPGLREWLVKQKERDEIVPGLREWLRGISLQKYEGKAEEWCAEMGAVSIKE
eukprot:8761252-Heterocapsa_arctica.AAC.1